MEDCKRSAREHTHIYAEPMDTDNCGEDGGAGVKGWGEMGVSCNSVNNKTFFGKKKERKKPVSEERGQWGLPPPWTLAEVPF